MFFKKYDKFDIQIGKPVDENINKQIDAEPPNDPLNEFDEFEMGLKLFCYEQNHYVILELGNQRINDLVFHRSVISPLGSGIEKVIAKLESGRKGSVTFGETVYGRSKWLELTPKKDKIICELDDSVYTLKYSKCIQKLKTFFIEVLKMAIAQGYIDLKEAEKEFGWKLS